MILSAVIGGADAATNIYLASSGMSGFGAYMCAVLAVAAVDAVLIYRRIKKNDK